MENTLKTTGTLRSGRTVSGKNITDIHLNKHEVYRLDGGGQVLVQALKGMLWVTQKGDGQDYILQPGEVFSAGADGLILIEGMKNSQFRLIV
jgi:hypothetical protein